jgi:[ribosomal protein S5]-alanine N-acetyltransferase
MPDHYMPPGSEEAVSNELVINDVLRDLPIIETERLILRRMRLDDAEDLFAYGSDPEVTRTTTWPTHLSIDDSRTFLTWVLEQYERGEHAGWGIEHRADGKFIGTVGYVMFSDAGYVGEIGYALARPYWGQGLTTEAAKAVIRFGFDYLGLHRIQATCHADNVGSYRVMEKAGMRFEGILRGSRYVKGRFDDVRMYALLRGDR